MRITAPVAKAARFTCGLPIKVEVVEGGGFLRTVGKPKLTLAQKLKAFDPAIHGGEVMATGRVGARPHPWKQVPPAVFEAACEGSAQRISQGNLRGLGY